MHYEVCEQQMHCDQLTSSSWALLEMQQVAHLFNDFLPLMEPENWFPCSQEHSTGPYFEPDQSSPYHPTLRLLRSILILSTQLRLGLPSGLFWFSHQYPISIPNHSMRGTCSTHLILPDFIILIILGEQYRLLSSSLCIFFQPPVTSPLFGSLQLSWENLPYTNFLHSTYQISCPFSLAQVVYPNNPFGPEVLCAIS
jgi:hypothetical protein